MITETKNIIIISTALIGIIIYTILKNLKESERFIEMIKQFKLKNLKHNKKIKTHKNRTFKHNKNKPLFINRSKKC